ncbi:MAG TPA: ATP-binding protein [Kofleriaceae bacterium]|nr:ATP-binding protein [Kofleriaceae bacterium]
MSELPTALALSVIDTLDDGVLSIDREHRVTLWNHRLAALTGIAAEAAIGRAVFDVMPSWRATEQHHIERALAGTPSLASAFPLVAPGRYEASYAPLDASPSERGALVIVRDVSPYDFARYQLHESDLRFRIMADTAPVLLWMAGTDSQCTFFNQPWLAFTGRSLDMELGVGWAEGVHPEDFTRCMDHYLAAFVARRPFRMEYRLRRADRQYRWLLDTGVPRYLPTGEFAGYIGSCIDITESKTVRDDLDRRVRERTAELEAFAYSVSHDLRAPLRAIDGFASALSDEWGQRLDGRGKDYLHRVRDSVHRMGDLIDDLLQLSQVGRSALAAESCDLSGVARGVVGSLRELEPARAVDIVIQDRVIVDGDPHLLRIALDNLLGNAWKFTSKVPNATIELSAVQRSGEVLIAVRDNGAGFDMAYARRLFNPFQRLHRVEEFPGTGVGLATVQRIVNRHGGRIWADSAPGCGASFFFTLPLRVAVEG